MTSIGPSQSIPPSGESTVASRIELLRAEAQRETDPARKARLLHAVGRLLDVHERNDVAAANEYLAAFQSARSHREALVDLIGIYERRKSSSNLGKLYQVDVKSAPDAETKASALLDLLAVRADLLDDANGAAGALAEAIATLPDHPDVALEAEMAARMASDAEALVERLKARIAGADDPSLVTELRIDLAELLSAAGRPDDAIATLRAGESRGAAGVRIAIALERVARRSGRRAERSEALERLAALAASASTESVRFEESGIGPYLWEDALSARAWAVAAYRAAANVRAADDLDPSAAGELYTRALAIEPDAPWIRLERLAVATRLGREAWAAEDEESLADVFGEGPVGAFVYNRLAARLERVGRTAEAEEARQEARRLAGGSPVLEAAVEGSLRHAANATAWLEALSPAAPDASERRLTEAAFVTSEILDRPEDAIALYERAIATREAPPAHLLVALYATALRAGRTEVALSALARLGGLDPASERVRVRQRAFLAAALLEDPSLAVGPATAMVAGSTDPTDLALARSIGALTDDHALVEQAHVALAARGDTETRAAHLVAAARASLARGDAQAARRHLERSTELAPGNPLAWTLLRRSLLSQGDSNAVAALDLRLAESRAGEPADILGRIQALAGAALSGGDTSDADALLRRRPASRAVRDTAATVAALGGTKDLLAGVLESTATLGTADERAAAALALARLDLPKGFSPAVRERLGAALDGNETSGDAALLLLLDPALTAADARVARASKALGIDPEAVFQGGATASTGSDSLAPAAVALDPTATALASLERLGGAPAVAAQITRSLSTGTLDERMDELGMFVLRAASAPGAGEVSAALLDVALPATGNLDVRSAALEAALRDAPDSAAVDVRLELAALRLEQKRPRDAVALVEAALVARPNDPAALEALRIAARDAGEFARFVEACDALAALATGDVRAELLEDASTVLAESLGDKRGALARAREALEARPGRKRAHDRVKSLLTELGDAAGLAALATRRATSASGASRVKQLFEAARHLRGANDKAGSLAAIDELLAIDPAHAGALAMKAEIHVSNESFGAAVDALRALASADVPPSQKKVARLGAADFLEKRLGDARGALAELEKVDALGQADAAILQRMARLCESEDFFDKALALHDRVAEIPNVHPLRAAESLRSAGKLRLTYKRDPSGAADAFRRALFLAPDDVDTGLRLIKLSGTDEERATVARALDAGVRSKLTPEGLNPDVLRKLLRVAELRGQRDLAKLLLSTLTVLRIATDDERNREEENTAFVRRVRPPQHSIAEGLAKLRAEGDGGPFDDIASQLFETLVELDAADLARFGANRGETLPKSDGVRTELTDLGAAFGIAEVEVHPSAQLDARRIVGVPSERGLAFVVPRGTAVPIDPALRFHAGRTTYATARRIFPIVQRPPEEAASMLLGALDAAEVALGDARNRPGVADWSKAIGRVLGRKQKKAIHDLGATVGDAGRTAEAYCRAARQSSLRAGLLVSSDLEAALSVVLGTTPSMERCAASREAADLVCFHLSVTSLGLRRDLGLSS